MMSKNVGLFDGCGGALGAAIFSPCGKFRYTLERRWADVPRYVLWIMLNPSTADASTNDATIRRCLGYARDWGYTGILVGNLYAYRATNPAELGKQLVAAAGRASRAPLHTRFDDYTAEVIGGENDAHLRELVRRASLVVCAWGQLGPLEGRRWQVMRLLADMGVPAHVLKFNRPSSGTLQEEPAHPLRLRKGLEPKVWELFPDHGPGAGG